MAKLEKVYKEALRLSRELDDNFVELGSLLRDIHEAEPARFKDFIKESAIDGRKAYYLIALDKTFGPLKISKKKLTSLGWTKLMTIQPYVTKDNVTKLLEIASENTVAKLRKIVQGQLPDTSERVLLFYFDEPQMAFVRAILLRFGAEPSGRGLSNKEAALIDALRQVPAGA